MEIKEGSTAYINIIFLNKNNIPEEPSTIQYRIDDVATDEMIRGVTDIAPATSVEIVMEPSDTRILNSSNKQENHKITVVAVYGDYDQVTGELIVKILPLAKVAGNPPAIVD